MLKKFAIYGIGLDMSKDHIHVCFGGYTDEQQFKIVAQRRFDNSKSGFKALVQWIEKNRKIKDIPLRVLMEVTGVYHEAVLYFLYHKGYQVSLELARRVKRYLESIGHKSKNDKLDGKGIARMICERSIEPWKPVSREILSIRDLLRHRRALTDAKTQFSNQIHAAEYHVNTQNSIVKSLRKLVKNLDQEIEKTEIKVTELAKENQEFYRKVRQISDTVKGLGFISVITVVAETNGFEKFTSIKQLVSYSGYDVVENSSGQFNGKTKISKRGNAHIRAIMYMPALSAIRAKSEPFYNLYSRVLKRNGGLKKKAAVAVQRKLLVLIYTLWKKDQPFDKNHRNVHHKPSILEIVKEKGSTDVLPVLQWIDNPKLENLPSSRKGRKNIKIPLH